MFTSTDRAALYAAIVREPEEDTPRLMFADEIEEADPARAEFIRVQCEIAAMVRSDPLGLNSSRSKFAHRLHHELQPRESALLTAHRSEWLKGPACAECRGRRVRSVYERGEYGPNSYQEDCPVCHGTGDAGGLTWEFDYPSAATVGTFVMDMESGVSVRREPVRVTFRRGLPHVKVPRLADTLSRDDAPSDWLAAVVAAHPVTECVPLDHEPTQNIANNYWMWVRGDTGLNLRDEIPSPLFDLLPTDSRFYHVENRPGDWRAYPTRALAVTALARTIPQFARRAQKKD